MTMSTRCKWISLFVMGTAAILLLMLFYGVSKKRRCPNEGDLMMEEDGECYKKNSQGPCMNNLVFAEFERSSPFGSCSCPYMFQNRSMLYLPEAKECFPVFGRGLCGDDEWLNMTEEGKPRCEKNTCLQYYTEEQRYNLSENVTLDIEFVPITGPARTINQTCAQLGQPLEGCPDGAVVRFYTNLIHASCHKPKTKKKFGQSLGAIGVAAYTSCPVGSYRSIMGRCQPTFDFDFE